MKAAEESPCRARMAPGVPGSCSLPPSRSLSGVAVPSSCPSAAASLRAGGWLAGGAGGTAARGVASVPPYWTGFVSTDEGLGLGAAAGGTVKSGVANAALGAGAVGPLGADGAA